MNQLQFFGVIEIGLIYSLVAVGVFITFRLIDFPDLTVDGSFTLGAAVSVTMILNGYNPYIATISAFFAGALSGIVTGWLNIKLNIMGLLSGILTMTALYSINLRIMGRPNISIIDLGTIYSNKSIILITFLIVVVIILFLTRFFASDFGLAIRAIGINSKVSSTYGIKVSVLKIVALALSNSIVSLAGSLFSQANGFAEILMGTGTIITGLASVIIGEAVIYLKRMLFSLVLCCIGSILYRCAIALALNAHDIGLESSDLNLITSILVIITLAIVQFKKNGDS